ncbi:3427_t:CDS:2 [Cetraspora pellucida]|uniref:3427_t:CDS:1 n=1 Tax=Cetraspora pellucida TaxID=1433469 RepID=A0A9N9ESQ7_9GLOM|nr:3427_t:CDS:2 [Cetraspora pellucida]
MNSEDQFIDFYELLGVSYNSTKEEIDKAYRRQAIKHHPDKNRGNTEEATKIFHKISKAYQTLTDPQKKLEYDNTYKARIAAKKRTEALDTKRRLMKEDLEEGEKAAKQTRKNVFTEESKQAKIERLKEETARRRRERGERLRAARGKVK